MFYQFNFIFKQHLLYDKIFLNFFLFIEEEYFIASIDFFSYNLT